MDLASDNLVRGRNYGRPAGAKRTSIPDKPVNEREQKEALTDARSLTCFNINWAFFTFINYENNLHTEYASMTFYVYILVRYIFR